MEICRSLKDINRLKNAVVTIGTFDGLHRGHQEVIRHVVSTASAKQSTSVVVTFDPHPRHILDKDFVLPLLINLEDKLHLIQELGIDTTVVIPFSQEFSHVTASDFISDIIVKNFQPNRIVIGYDHHFGKDREGSPEFLSQFGAEHQIEVNIIEPVHDQDVIISSTHIRKLIHEGFVRRASFELGRVYGFRAKVVYGAGRGKDLEFPTANFIPVENNQLLPKQGVYFARGRINGNNLYGMCNLGVRPTFNETDFVMEVHFFEKSIGDLYEKEITIEFLERIRDEKKFNDSSELKKQLVKDQQECEELIKKYH
ncbi:MAG: bifunctional riboflavin kinase/FAD synthetase [Candidatus Marinimicrobia bacterium]|jgi:riboflavin kinase/FMN adenylyltransferase|nr:bifunctional riboflavin kinase/FAD synthetase [Candidatus Neomarinimicrobiota bacterium]MDP7072277.1 bifunctional riboflavin kinase/FAD synthetase [Candidatus Neomarinimicrobiota bacterium]